MKNTFTLKVSNKYEKDFESFHELYAYFDYEVSVYDFDDCKVYLNGHLLKGSPTDIANRETYKTSMWLR